MLKVICLLRPYEPICDDPTLTNYDQSEPDDYCYETKGDNFSEQHYVYFEHLESNQIYTCNSYEVQKLIDQGVDLNSVEYQGRPILYHAVKNGYSSIVKMLLNAGASSDFKIPDGRGLLHVAAENGRQLTMGEIILAHPFAKPIKDFKHLLIFSSTRKKLKSIVDVKDHFETTPLILAAQFGHKAVVKTLLDCGADIDYVDANGWSARTVAEQELSVADAFEKQNYQDIVNLFNNYIGEINRFHQQCNTDVQIVAGALLSYFMIFIGVGKLFKNRNQAYIRERNIIDQIISEIKELSDPLSKAETVLLEEKVPLVCAISHDELTSSDEIYCIEDIKNLYVSSALVTWIKRTAKLSEDRNNVTFIHPITHQRVSINMVFEVTKQLQHFLESEEGLDQSQSQATSADEQAADQSVAANTFVARVSRQRQMRASGQSL